MTEPLRALTIRQPVTNTNGKRALYEANGWLVRKQDPRDVPVLLGGSVMALLDDLGGWTATDTHEHKGAAA